MNKNIDVNKVILVILVILMVLPATISIAGISLFKIAFVIIAAIAIYLFVTNREEIKKAIKNKFILFNILFVLSILVSLMANHNTIMFNDIYEALKYIIFATVSLIILTICRDKQYYIFLLKTICITMIAICIFGVIQYFNPFSINELYIKSFAPTQYKTLINDYSNPRIVGTKSNPAVYGLLMTMGVYFNLMYYKYAKHKSLCLLSGLLCLVNLMLTLTRTIQIAFLCSIIVCILMTVLLKKGWKRAALVTIVTIISIFLLLQILPEQITWRLNQITDLSNVNSFKLRLEKWEGYFNIINQNWLVGMGPVKNYVQELGYIDSEIIQNILQYGLLGFTTYIIMLLSPFYIYFKKKTNKSIIKYYLPILILIMINNIAASTLILYETAIPVYIMIALIIIGEEFNIKEKKSDEKNILYITYTDMKDADSGSGVRPQKIYKAFIDKGYNVKLLYGSFLKETKNQRVERVKEINEWLDYNKPAFCYIESPSDPIILKEDRKIIKRIHEEGIKIGYFYRDAYYKLGKDCLFNGERVKMLSKKYMRYLYYKFLFWRDENLIKNYIDIVYFPSETMAKYFSFKNKNILPPAGEILDYNKKDSNSVIYVGGISKRYGINYLLESMEIINSIQDLNLILVCREKEINNIEDRYLQKKWLQIYHVSGEEQLKELYEKAKIALFPLVPTIYNDLSISVKLFEYMSYNLPIVAINTLEVRKIIEKYEIGIVTEANSEEFAKAILKVYNDKELYIKIQANAKMALLNENLWTHRVEKIAKDLTNNIEG